MLRNLLSRLLYLAMLASILSFTATSCTDRKDPADRDAAHVPDRPPDHDAPPRVPMN